MSVAFCAAMPRCLSRSSGLSVTWRARVDALRIGQIDRADRNHFHRRAAGRCRRHHDHGGNAAERGERQTFDHLLIGDDLVSAGRQQAIDALDPERVFESDGFPPRACGHTRVSFANSAAPTLLLCMASIVRSFGPISYRFLAGWTVSGRITFALPCIRPFSSPPPQATGTSPEISRPNRPRDQTCGCVHTFKLDFNCRSEAVPMIPSGDGDVLFFKSANGWDRVLCMKIRVGFEMIYDFPHPTPWITVLGIHFTRASDIIVPDHLTTSPSVPITPYRDGFGNWCSRIVAPAGRMQLAADGTVRDNGLPDVVVPSAAQHAVEDLPADTLVYLLGSRYCETDRLSDIAWKLFEKTTPGWGRVQAICDFVHGHIAFGYEHARPTMTAWQVFDEGKGVCRDYAPLAIAFCRCMNIPARYCTGYLGDIGMPPPYAAGDFAGWFEAYIGGRWYTFDARHKHPPIRRGLIAPCRRAAG